MTVSTYHVDVDVEVVLSLHYVAMSAVKRSSVRPYLQLCVEGFMSYLHYLCLLPYSGVKHILCCVFALIVFVRNVACFSGLSILDGPFDCLYRLYKERQERY